MSASRVPSLDAIRDIVRENQATKLRFKTPEGKTKLVMLDLFTASAIMRVHASVKPANQQRIADMVASADLGKFLRLQDLAMSA